MKIYGGKCKRYMGRETGGDEYVLKEIKASKSECGICERKYKPLPSIFTPGTDYQTDNSPYSG